MRLKHLFPLLAGLLLTLPALAQPFPMGDPRRPRVATSDEDLMIRLNNIYRSSPITRDCGCPYLQDAQDGLPSGTADTVQCGIARPPGEFAHYGTRWSYLVNPEELARGRACWRGAAEICERYKKAGQELSPIECCKRSDPDIAGLARDAYNFIPLLEPIEQARGNMRIAPAPNGSTPFGSCGVRIDSSAQLFQPAPRFMGDYARALLYLHRAWGVPLSPAQINTYAQWSQQDPVDRMEDIQMRSIVQEQKVFNPEIPIGLRGVPDGFAVLPGGGPTRPTSP